jgi:cytochrome c553
MKVLVLILFCFTANANSLYKKKCMSCHGKNAEGKKSQKAPKLAGQHAWYLESQIKLIRDKKRKSGHSKRMYPFVKKLTNKEIKEVAKYLEGIEKKQEVAEESFKIIHNPCLGEKKPKYCPNYKEPLGSGPFGEVTLCDEEPSLPECTIELDDYVPSKVVSICDEEPKPAVCFL